MPRYLRNKRDGFIYDWNEILANNPACEEVTEEQAYPERFKPERANRPTMVAGLDTSDLDIAAALGENFVSPELQRDIARRWPR